ncbi:MAG: hypothetical protein Phog2KO_35740 [Phototrophicaceae bacterium]
MKKLLATLILLFLLSSHIIAQDDPQYIQVNSGTDVIINSGQSAYIVLQVNNPSADTLIGVEILCTVDTVSGTTSIDTDNTQAYILDTVEFTDTTANFGADADIDLVAGQSGNVQLVINAEASATEIAKAVISCDMLTNGVSLGSVDIELASTEARPSNSSANSDDSAQTTATGGTISINNGAEIRVTEGESIELVIQVGNAGQETLENTLVICSLDELEGELVIVEERTDARDFGSYVVEDNMIIFGQDEDISLIAGQNTSIALGIELNSGSLSAGVSCSISSDSDAEASDPSTALVSNRDNDPVEDSSSDDSDSSSTDSTGSLSINNGSEMMIGNGQSAELVLQFGNSSETTLETVSIVCSIATDEGSLIFSDERTNTYDAGEYVIDDSTLTINIDRDMPQGQNMNVAVGIQVDEVDTDGTVSCELSNDGEVLGSDTIAISGN